MKRKYNKHKVKATPKPEEKAYTKADLNKAKVEGWNRAIEALTEQVNEIPITSGRMWFFFDDFKGKSEMKQQILKMLKENIYPA